MRSSVFIFLSFCLLQLSAFAQLSGNYTIDPNGSGSTNYTSFSAAITDLETIGVNGNVTFHVKEGTYTEQLNIDSIPGTSDSSIVVFMADPANTTDARIHHNASCNENWVVRISNTSWITFDELVFRNTSSGLCNTVFQLEQSSQQITIHDCELYGKVQSVNISQNSTLVTGFGDLADLRITGSLFHGACYGVRLNGVWQGSDQLTLQGNTFANQFYNAVDVREFNNVLFDQNIVTADSFLYLYSTAVEMDFCDNLQFTNNRIGSDVGSGYRMGLYLYNCTNSFDQKGLIANNCINIGTDSTSYSRLGIILSQVVYFDFHHNTVHLRSSNASSTAIILSSGGANHLYNNLVTTQAGMLVALYTQAVAFQMDYNAYFSPTTSAYYGNGQFVNSLSEWQSVVTMDTHSLWSEPGFVNALQCTTCNTDLDNAGTPTDVDNDIQGQVRSVTQPDIGAMEFLTPANFSLGPDETLCQDSLLLEATGADATWLINGTTEQSATIWLETNCAPAMSNVQVSVEDANCGVASDTVNITLVPHPALNQSLHLCAHDTATISVCGGTSASYQWSVGHNTQHLQVDQPGTYSLLKTELGCTHYDTIEVTRSEALILVDQLACLDDAPVSMDATLEHGIDYQWSGGTNLNQPTNMLDSSGTYSVTVLDSFGCEEISDFELFILPAPVATMTETKLNFLTYQYNASNSENITSSSFYYWEFSMNNVPFSASFIANPIVTFPNNDAPGTTYQVEVWVDNGCGVDSAKKNYGNISGVNTLETSPLRIYPNPMQTETRVECPTCTESYTLRLFNAAGQEQRSIQVDSPQLFELKRGHLGPGTYFYEMESGQGSVHRGKLLIID